MRAPRDLTTNPPMSQPGRARRRRLYHSPLRRDWMPWEVDRLISLVEQGYSYDQIAKRMERTRLAVMLKCRRLRISVTTSPATISAQDVAQLLGLGCARTVTRWITLGWIKARNAGGSKNKPLWRIQWEDLTAFMEQRTGWMAWSPDRVTDPALREWAQELRQGQPRWLTTSEVARRCHVYMHTPNTWIAKGLIPAIRYGPYWIWESDLIGFVVPIDRPREGRYRHHVSLMTTIPPVLDQGARTADQIADVLGAKPRSVKQALRRLEDRGQARRVDAGERAHNPRWERVYDPQS